MKSSATARILTGVLCALFVAGIALVVSLPAFLDFYMVILYDAYFVLPGYRTFILVFCMAVGALGLWIIAELLVTLHTIDGDPFVLRNVRALRRMGVAAAGAAVLFFVKCALYVTPLTLVGGLACGLCALVAFTVADLFRQAVAFKQEIDLTI